MSALDMLDTIGSAKPGTRMLVAEAFDAVDASRAGTVRLPFGTELEISLGNRQSLSATADLGARLQPVYIFCEQYHCLARQS